VFPLTILWLQDLSTVQMRKLKKLLLSNSTIHKLKNVLAS
jgi:hypothetical protein